MRITVTTTSQKLSEILTKEQVIKINKSNSTRLFIQNLGATDIYIDTIDADKQDSVLIKSRYAAEDINFTNLGRIYLISDGGDNDNIRLIIT